MARHQESAAKQATRLLILDGCRTLQRGSLTYLGLPAEEALDIKVLAPLLENVICVADRARVLEEARRSIATLPLRGRRFVQADMWEYLRDEYPREPLVADVTFLDFYGGGLRKGNPYALEIAGLRSYFAKHARQSARAFILAWTYMPRDAGPEGYVRELAKSLPTDEVQLLRRSSGTELRSLAVRLLLKQCLREHGMDVKLFQHAVYKAIMNTVIILFSRGQDPTCRLSLESPHTLLTEPMCVYEVAQPVPRLVPLVT